MEVTLVRTMVPDWLVEEELLALNATWVAEAGSAPRVLVGAVVVVEVMLVVAGVVVVVLVVVVVALAVVVGEVVVTVVAAVVVVAISSLATWLAGGTCEQAHCCTLAGSVVEFVTILSILLLGGTPIAPPTPAGVMT